ncbi:MAG: hypothetical protein ABIP39_16885 [Polyangiaceae bacterium]
MDGKLADASPVPSAVEPEKTETVKTTEPTTAPPVVAPSRASWRTSSRKWLFAIVPAVAVVELVLHLVQVSSVVPDADWTAARDATKSLAKADDLVIFAPKWADPLGRQFFGSDVATLDREAFADVSRFERAVEVSIRGQHAPELAGWRSKETKSIGRITLTTFENPSYQKTIDDLLLHVNPAQMQVTRVNGDTEQTCPFTGGPVGTGNLGFGPAIPGDKFNCGNSPVGISVVSDLGYTPHKCLYAPPSGGGATRIKFENVTFGDVLHGHHGLYVEAERGREGAPITLSFSVGERRLGKMTHVDGDGWKGFELPTPELKGQKGELVAEVASPNGNRRTYCFEAITR